MGNPTTQKGNVAYFHIGIHFYHATAVTTQTILTTLLAVVRICKAWRILIDICQFNATSVNYRPNRRPRKLKRINLLNCRMRHRIKTDDVHSRWSKRWSESIYICVIRKSLYISITFLLVSWNNYNGNNTNNTTNNNNSNSTIFCIFIYVALFCDASE